MRSLNFNGWLYYYSLRFASVAVKMIKMRLQEPYDPSQPVTVTDFAPKAGGANTE